MQNLSPQKNRKPSIKKITFGILICIFGLNLYLRAGLVDNAGLALFIAGVVLLSFGIKDYFLKIAKTSRIENFFVWLFTGSIISISAILVIKGIRTSYGKCAPGSGNINQWCEVSLVGWSTIQLIGMSVIFIALFNLFFNKKHE